MSKLLHEVIKSHDIDNADKKYLASGGLYNLLSKLIKV